MISIAIALRDHFAESGIDAVRSIASKWPRSSVVAVAETPATLPVTGWLNDASQGPAINDLRDIASALHWQQTYTATDIGAPFLERYGWTMLVGPDAPIKSDAILAGILILGPDIEYPVHRHSAEEAYVILSGTASWSIGNSDWHQKSAGEVIHNPPWQPHGMCTDCGEPLVLGFLWNAGAVEKSQID
ncbi:Dimethlysulfonioproprionate lyase [Cognatiyoonia sediminum]|uniref:Dimethlysulfonioproprionate lyase n=1 Tax=Cognatiyoonia sediminum TaxID=1508389 RepID=A0A1M5RD13_9RHOB|nr:Dimethlysulfonioproprionate lyase [Cognatiyoonia sediminum]